MPTNAIQGKIMSQIADLVGYDLDGQIALIVDVKSRVDTSRSWATRMRRNILAHGMVPNSQFLLLALPDRLYLWKDAGNQPELVEPTFEIDAKPFFQPYYDSADLNPQELNGTGFELIVASWLNELMRSGIRDEVPETERRALERSGLLHAIKGGSIELEVSA